MRLRLAWPYALRSLLRGGQRTALAIFCVAVGVMAIVALQLVGQSVNSALTGNIIEANGGDVQLTSVLVPLQGTDLAQFAALQAQGRIRAYATTYEIPSQITASAGSTVPFDLVAVSANYPLVGQANFTAPSPALRVQDVVRGDQVAMSALVANLLRAHIGSSYTLHTGDNQTLTVVVAAIFAEGGAFQGPQVLVSAATLQATPGPSGALLPPRVTGITMLTSDPAGVEATLRQQFPAATVLTAADELRLRQQDVAQIRLFLRIVALLALFIGGVGIVNTMQVLLRRRRLEIAMLKTLGYRQRDLYAIFGMEAALLGLAGSVLGVALGIGAAFIVRTIIASAFFLHLEIPIDPALLASGVGVGVITALIFGLLPIVQASSIRPIAILREEESGRISRIGQIGLLLLLSVLFVTLAAGILGDVRVAAEVVYGGVAAVALLAGGFSLLILAISRLPVYDRPTPRILLVFLAVLAYCGALAAIPIGLLWRFGRPDVLALVRDGAYAALAGGLAAVGIWLALTTGAVVVLLAAVLDGLVMFAPRAWKTAVLLAFRNLGRQRGRSTATLTALFVGVFAIGAIVILGQGIKDAVNTTISSLFTHNLFVVTAPSQAPIVPLIVDGQAGVDATRTVTDPVARVIPVTIGDRGIATVLAGQGTQTGAPQDFARRQAIVLALSIVEGFNVGDGQALARPNVVITVGRNLTPTDAGTTNVVLDDILTLPPVNLQLGETITVLGSTPASGAAQPVRLTIVGFFSRLRTTDFVPGEILADSAIASQLGGASTLTIVGLKVDPNAVPAVRQLISQAVPGAQIVSLTDLNGVFDRILNDLIIMLSAIASLALIAGLIIIANAVALAMLERRREIGILKSVGHTSGSILAMVLVENGVIGLLGALVAMTLVTGLIVALATLVFQRALAISFPLVGVIIAVTIALTLAVTALVAWNAVRVRPLEVLRYD